MASNPNFDEALQSLTTFATAPFVLFASEAMRQPAVQSAIREGYVLSERMNEAIAEIQETLEDLAAQAQARLVEEQQQPDNPSSAHHSDIAEGINRVLSTLNKHTHRLSNGAVDLRLLMSMGFAALAVRQLVDKGLELDEIPWYTLAWYAFDSFVKLNANPNETMADTLVDLGNQVAELGES